MSMADFQRALCAMTLDPALAASVRRGGTGALADFTLTELEQVRLVAVVRQRGMSVNCTLARANRFAPIADAFPLTCSLLKPMLRSLLDELWSAHQPGDYQLTGEVDAFAAFLDRKLSQGGVDHPYAEEVFRYECAGRRLIQSLLQQPPAREEAPVTVRFVHDPQVLVGCLERDTMPPPGLPIGDHLVQLTLRGDVLEVHTVS